MSFGRRKGLTPTTLTRLSHPRSPVTPTPRTDTKEVERRATSAIICFYHPSVDKSERPQKKQWAEFFETTKERFKFWEIKLDASIPRLTQAPSTASP